MEAYIDRDATVESLNALKPFLRDRGQVQLLRRIMNHIGKIPVADVVPVVHGQWLDDQYFWRCSACLEWLEVAQGTADMNYCPHCGARMDGEDNG